jgi:hypothetical protein
MKGARRPDETGWDVYSGPWRGVRVAGVQPAGTAGAAPGRVGLERRGGSPGGCGG